MNVADQIAEICRLEGVRLIAGVMGGSATQLVRALDGIPGHKALYCRQELVELAKLLSLPVATTLNGKSGFPETHPLSLGMGGYARATYSSLQADAFAAEADVVLGIGVGFKRDATKEKMPAETKLIQIDVDPGALSNVYPANVTVLGDAKAVLRQLIDAARDLPKSRLDARLEIAARIRELKERFWVLSGPMLTSGAYTACACARRACRYELGVRARL